MPGKKEGRVSRYGDTPAFVRDCKGKEKKERKM
jgi:hypothetical protein